jgi:hypothetical protein
MTVSLSRTLPLNPPDMSVAATTTTPGGSAPNGFQGVAPSHFNGKRNHTDNFLNEFCCYKLLNKEKNAMKIPFYRVLMAVSYIHGPLIEDWVNAQDMALEKCVDPSIPRSLAKSDETLWTEFKNQFKSAWQDTAKVQSAYKKLTRLTMQGYDIDTYNAIFAHLASAAEWELNAKGTVDRYRQGLRSNIHCKILEHKKWPTDMEGWMEAA